jgi:hypothetical protein
MPNQRLRETFDETPQLLAVVICRFTRAAVSLESLEARRESAVLLDILLHEALDAGDRLDVGEEAFLFGVVVVVHGFAPALAVDEEVAGNGNVSRREMRCLEVD